MEEKKEIRKKIFKARKEHTDAWIRENSLRITETLTQLPEYRISGRKTEFTARKAMAEIQTSPC